MTSPNRSDWWMVELSALVGGKIMLDSADFNRSSCGDMFCVRAHPPRGKFSCVLGCRVPLPQVCATSTMHGRNGNLPKAHIGNFRQEASTPKESGGQGTVRRAAFIHRPPPPINVPEAFPCLKKVEWKESTDGVGSGVYCAASHGAQILGDA